MSSKSFDDAEKASDLVASGHVVPALVDTQQLVEIDPEEEKKVNRILDMRMLPLLTLMYTFSALDRSNLGAAKTDHMDTDLNFGINDYSLILTIFYAPFCLLTVPANMLTKKVGAHITLPTYMIIWGGLASVNAAAKTAGQVMAIRVLLGAAEAGFAVGCISHLTTFYRRDQLAVRIAYLYVASPLAGAIGGLLAYGIFQIKSQLHGWQILFIFEGVMTVATGVLAAVMLPRSVATCKWLTPAQRELCQARVLADSSNVINDKFSCKLFFAPVMDPLLYVYGLIGISYGVPVAAVSNWLPQVIQRLGYDKLRTNALTVPPYAFGCLTLLFMAWNSDRTRERSLHVVAALVSTFIGFVILAALDPTQSKNTGPSIFAVFLLCAGAFIPSVLFHTWHQNNDPSPNGRAFRVAFLTFCANAGGLVSSQAFRQQEAPRYQTAMYTNFAFLAFGIALVLGLR
ncbi:hypothetical protein JCM10213_001514, partial [Rhodosporidiobolus nylandii]